MSHLPTTDIRHPDGFGAPDVAVGHAELWQFVVASADWGSVHTSVLVVSQSNPKNTFFE